ncbi:MAG: hypothetical protein RIK87_24470 [Fuerstiella sp.]
MVHSECAVCGDPIPSLSRGRLQEPTFPVCRAAECRMVASEWSTMDPTVFRHQLRIRRRLIRERRQRAAVRRQRLAERRIREAAEAQQIIRDVLHRHSELSADDFDTLEIPSGHTATSMLEPDRVENYTRHLREMVSRAAQSSLEAAPVEADKKAPQELQRSEARFAESPTLRIISDRLCEMCKGGCCTAGGDTAYIRVDTVRRFMNRHQELSPEDVLQAYLSKVSSETVTGACINQTGSGCGLPREMRSDTCNGYYCDSLRNWHERPAQERCDTVLAVQRSNANWCQTDLDSPNSVVDVALVSTTSTERMNIRPEQAAGE